jgi:hypothetical protein
MEPDSLNPANRPPGTAIGGWRLLEQCGRGTYGVVYRAHSAEAPQRVVALKLALYPSDVRFVREAESGHFLGASTLTWQTFPPGTPSYRPPEAWDYVLGSRKPPATAYAPGPADDVFALGVTAYRLATGMYPPLPHPRGEEVRLWHPEKLALWTARTKNPQCVPELSALVSRMLALRPEARGSAREVAEALEEAAWKAGPEADVPLFTGEEPRLAGLFPPIPRVTVPPPPRVARGPWFVAAGLGASLSLGVMLSTRSVEPAEPTHLAEGEESKDGGVVAVGEEALTAPAASESAISMLSVIRAEVPPKPFPKQRRPDRDGRCFGKNMVAINGGCWVKLPVELRDCEATAGLEYKGACYVPVWEPRRPPTSGPTNRDDAP